MVTLRLAGVTRDRSAGETCVRLRPTTRFDLPSGKTVHHETNDLDASVERGDGRDGDHPTRSEWLFTDSEATRVALGEFVDFDQADTGRTAHAGHVYGVSAEGEGDHNCGVSRGVG